VAAERVTLRPAEMNEAFLCFSFVTRPDLTSSKFFVLDPEGIFRSVFRFLWLPSDRCGACHSFRSSRSSFPPFFLSC